MKPTHEQAIFYLKFVDAAYTMYESDPSSLTPPAQGFPDSNYEILIYLTSTDPVSGQQVFFGFIAADTSQNSGKPGILAIRGTDNPYEWITDFDAVPTTFQPFGNIDAWVATGFLEFVQGIQWIQPNGVQADGPALSAEDWPQGLVLAGHSLGGAMTTLLAATWWAAIPALMLTLVTAACPACGDWAFKAEFDILANGRSWRYINDLDVVASFLDPVYYQVDTGEPLSSDDIWPTPECEHSLTTYLWLLSPPDTPCDFSCCIFDDEVKARVRRLRDQRREIAERAR